MRSDKSQALKLRLSGRSYNEISTTLKIPKSTLASWFTGLELSNAAQDRLKKRINDTAISALVKRNHAQTHIAQKNARTIRDKSRLEISNLSQRELMILGASLYWAEGYKRPKVVGGKIKTYHPVSLSNSDPLLVKIYLKFLREACEVPEERINAEIRLYEHHNKEHLIDFWRKTTGIPYNRLKTIENGVSISSKGVRPYNILPYGTIQIRVNSTQLYHKIMGWIEGLGKA